MGDTLQKKIDRVGNDPRDYKEHANFRNVRNGGMFSNGRSVCLVSLSPSFCLLTGSSSGCESLALAEPVPWPAVGCFQ